MSRRCRLCSRPLRDPLWRARGVGRFCARRAGLVASRRFPTVLVWSARAMPGEGQLSLFDEIGEGGA